MQLQCDVGILGGVSGGAVDLHLIERNLFRTLAGDILVRGRRDAEIFLGGRGHVMAPRNAVQNVGFEHGIKSLPGEGDAMIGEHMSIVLQVVT